MSAKQIIVLRKDLNMRKGKMVAQGSHASLAVFFNLIKSQESGEVLAEEGKFSYKFTHTRPNMHEWIMGRFTKICVGVDSEAELLAIYEQAKKAGLPCSLIQDAGLTEFKVPTYTAVAVGPEDSEAIDEITGHLRLL